MNTNPNPGPNLYAILVTALFLTGIGLALLDQLGTLCLP